MTVVQNLENHGTDECIKNLALKVDQVQQEREYDRQEFEERLREER